MYYVTFRANDGKIRTFKLPHRVATAVAAGMYSAGLHHIVRPVVVAR